MRQTICFVLASALLLGGIWLMYMEVFVWPVFVGKFVMAAGLLITVGGGWLFGDFVLPFFRKR